MGWNQVHSSHALFKGLEGAYFYFVHSYCAGLGEYTIADCEYSQNLAQV